MSDDANLKRFHRLAGTKLAEIADGAWPGAKLTLVVRMPGNTEREIVLTDDNGNRAEVLATIERRMP